MDHLGNFMDALAKEQLKAVKDMSKAKNLEERKIHSEIVLNLSRSMAMMMDSAANVMTGLDQDMPFED
ncbi:MAG: hypothetical protein EOM25_13850 [Deltaproteobacteria bacterium]|nr:hypothetical protein [Deltaproteobacteria bacterium]